jgi:hypothetical protein
MKSDTKSETKPKPAGELISNSINTTIKNTKYMKLFKTPNSQTQFDSKSGISSFIADYNNEITKYHLMKNKNYLLCATRSKLILFNIMKLRKIAEFLINPNSNSNNLNSFTFEKMIEVLNKYDTVTLKSWFSVDIKLGVVSITFTQENMFNNPFNFDAEFLEKVLDRTNSFTKVVNIDFKFVNDISSSPLNTPQLNRTMNSKLSDISTKSDSSKFSSTMPSASAKKGKSLSNIEKVSSCGYILFKMIYSNYVTRMLERYTVFFDEYFWDTRDYLKNELARMDSGKYINNNLFNFSSSNTGSPISAPTFFLFSTSENFISVAPYYEDISNKFKLPSFLKENVQMVRNFFLNLIFNSIFSQILILLLLPK